MPGVTLVPSTHDAPPFPTEDHCACSTDAGARKVERGLEPVGQGLHRAGITADGLTIIGLVFAIGTALLIADGHLLLGVFGVVLTGLPDILDGSVARQSGRAGPRGAFFDSVCDRVADAALFIGVAWYLSETDDAALRRPRDGGARARRCSSPTSAPRPSRSGSRRAAGSWSAPSGSCCSASASRSTSSSRCSG